MIEKLMIYTVATLMTIGNAIIFHFAVNEGINEIQYLILFIYGIMIFLAKM